MNETEKKIQNQRAAVRRLCEPPQGDGSMRFHRMHQFWELAHGLPIKKVRLIELDGFDEVRWQQRQAIFGKWGVHFKEDSRP